MIRLLIDLTDSGFNADSYKVDVTIELEGRAYSKVTYIPKTIFVSQFDVIWDIAGRTLLDTVKRSVE